MNTEITPLGSGTVVEKVLLNRKLTVEALSAACVAFEESIKSSDLLPQIQHLVMINFVETVFGNLKKISDVVGDAERGTLKLPDDYVTLDTLGGGEE